MEQNNVKAKVIVDNSSGDVKVVSKKGRLAFPVEVIESGTDGSRRIGNRIEFLKLLREVKRKKQVRAVSKRVIIEQRIHALMRNLHQPA